ncbi:phosphatase PAP2 family protein [Winogradskyella sp. MIT101101]|uniref:phosphatase PAP2 family protein n=1 Tax=Winogradskyella sp. MIT101101 TaxID=3098297 RepID=UPI003999D768
MRKQLIDFLRGLKNLLKEKFHNSNPKWPYIITAFLSTILVVVSIILFVKFTHGMMSELFESYDKAISEYVWTHKSAFLTDYMVAVTEIGDVIGYGIVFGLLIVVFLAVFKHWKYIAQLGLVLILALSSNVLLKEIINRSRPLGEHMVTVKTLSYPSGHAMVSMAFYGFLIYLIAYFKMNKVLKVCLITILTILILSIGISRIYLGVHYPSDVLGGYIAGIMWVTFCVLIFNLVKIFRRDPAT